MSRPIIDYLVTAATRLWTKRDFSIKGDITAPKVSFDGTEDVALTATLKSVGTEGTYGSKNKIPKLTTDAKGRVTGVEEVDLGGTTHYLVNEVTTIQPGQTKSYNLSTIMGSNASSYDIDGLAVVTLVKDTDASSPTHNYFINSEAVLVIGVSANQLTVVVHNARDIAVEARVKISVGAA